MTNNREAEGADRALSDNEKWNLAGREPYKFHPQASHVSPDYRDGWNHALDAAARSTAPEGRALPDGVACTTDGKRCSTYVECAAKGCMRALSDGGEELRAADELEAANAALIDATTRVNNAVRALARPTQPAPASQEGAK